MKLPALSSPETVQVHVQHRDPELWQASRQFEKLLWHQMVTAMRKTVPESGFLPSGFAEEMYSGMFSEALSTVAASHASLGLAEQIYRQFSDDECGMERLGGAKVLRGVTENNNSAPDKKE